MIDSTEDRFRVLLPFIPVIWLETAKIRPDLPIKFKHRKNNPFLLINLAHS